MIFSFSKKMENKKHHAKDEKEKDPDDDLHSFINLTVYTDRVIELINQNIIDYSCKYHIIINF